MKSVNGTVEDFGREERGREEEELSDKDLLFLMSNLTSKYTGLPFVVWISPPGGAKHDVEVKVSTSARALPSEMASVAIRPDVHVVGGSLSPQQLEPLRRWIDLNREVLIKFWDGEIDDSRDALMALKSIEFLAPDKPK